MSTIAVEALTADEIRTNVRRELCELVRDSVSGGASVGWVTVPSELEASNYWRGVAEQVESGAMMVLVAGSPSAVVGTVQLHLSARPNGAHRAEVARLLVHLRARRRGIGAALMRAIEEEALKHRVSLLVLDTRTGDPSQQLYEKIGYSLAGMIPNYARGTTGTLEPTSIMYKEIKDAGDHVT
jgi:ribosomal protein S18 acetylase RimI-like enzyme